MPTRLGVVAERDLSDGEESAGVEDERPGGLSGGLAQKPHPSVDPAPGCVGAGAGRQVSPSFSGQVEEQRLSFLGAGIAASGRGKERCCGRGDAREQQSGKQSAEEPRPEGPGSGEQAGGVSATSPLAGPGQGRTSSVKILTSSNFPVARRVVSPTLPVLAMELSVMSTTRSQLK